VFPLLAYVVSRELAQVSAGNPTVSGQLGPATARMAPASPLAPSRRGRREKKEATLELEPQPTELTQATLYPGPCAAHERFKVPSDKGQSTVVTRGGTS
jgi:hypothetical protein